MTSERHRRVPARLANEIDALCVDLEQRWRANQAPRIEEYLLRVPTEWRSVALVELIAQ